MKIIKKIDEAVKYKIEAQALLFENQKSLSEILNESKENLNRIKLENHLMFKYSDLKPKVKNLKVG
ncbi:MAG: hypothetical protein JJT78_10745 [Leptospira sp.]|nr:hypothetical protein [Leptospira sp.]